MPPEDLLEILKDGGICDARQNARIKETELKCNAFFLFLPLCSCSFAISVFVLMT